MPVTKRQVCRAFPRRSMALVVGVTAYAHTCGIAPGMLVRAMLVSGPRRRYNPAQNVWRVWVAVRPLPGHDRPAFGCYLPAEYLEPVPHLRPRRRRGRP